jgi:hypothetical protein
MNWAGVPSSTLTIGLLREVAGERCLPATFAIPVEGLQHLKLRLQLRPPLSYPLASPLPPTLGFLYCGSSLP